ncbi:BTB/POZ domain-containing protein [Microdochium nivale]|nr:BTB/POZ domain-containing protein [Microdochium nivale]
MPDSTSPDGPAAVMTRTDIIDARGDLFLIVGTSLTETPPPVRYQVCSKTLARSSPVFDKMLFGGFAESLPSMQDNSDWVIELPEDNTGAMAQVLHLMHGSYAKFTLGSKPKFDSAEELMLLYKFFVAADKYDCTPLTQPWAQRWLDAISSMGSRGYNELYMLTWIYFQLGHQRCYEIVMEKLISVSRRPLAHSTVMVLPPDIFGEKQGL